MPDDKTFRIPVKFVSAVDGSDLPIGGYVLVHEHRLRKLEAVAASSSNLLERVATARANPGAVVETEPARQQLASDLAALVDS
jgi:hypothetical protein